MKRGITRPVIISLAAILLLGALVFAYWKWPRPLSYYLELPAAPDYGTLILHRSPGSSDQVDLEEKEDIAALWAVIEDTTVVHTGFTDFIDYTDSQLYDLRFQVYEDDLFLKDAAFSYVSDGSIHIGKAVFRVQDDAALRSLLESLFPEADSAPAGA